VITAYRSGENTQVRALAEALGEPYLVKQLDYNPFAAFFGLLRIVSTLGLNKNNATGLSAPWPDIVIAAGLKNEPICRWIRKQSANKTKLVFIGRTWAPLQHFDLLITTPQYRLPQRANVLHNQLTLHNITVQKLQAVALSANETLQKLPQPRIAVLIGGNSGPYTFGVKAASKLAELVNNFAKTQGGSLLVTNSARTVSGMLDHFCKFISVPSYVFNWSAEKDNNPYLSYLALADVFVVTADSIAMLSEVCATNKPVFIFDTNKQAYDFSLRARVYQWLMLWGPARATRDTNLVHHQLISSGRANWLEDAHTDTKNVESIHDVERSVLRVKQLMKTNQSVG
jgi:mitochondrial fission protein ELM1